jgi:hypothetical protein
MVADTTISTSISYRRKGEGFSENRKPLTPASFRSANDPDFQEPQRIKDF